MDRKEIIETLEEEIKHIKKQVYPQDMETTMWVDKRIEALEKAIDIIKYHL